MKGEDRSNIYNDDPKCQLVDGRLDDFVNRIVIKPVGGEVTTPGCGEKRRCKDRGRNLYNSCTIEEEMAPRLIEPLRNKKSVVLIYF